MLRSMKSNAVYTVSGNAVSRRCCGCFLPRRSHVPLVRLRQQRPSKAASRRPFCAAERENGSVAAPATAQRQEGLIFARGEPGSWDEAGVGTPIVRCYLGDNEQRWLMWYSGRSSQCPDMDAVIPASGSAGVATSSDGVTWERGSEAVSGTAGDDTEVGLVLGPNPDSWWWHDTCHLTVSDVQILSSGSVGSGVGVYWMFYSGGSFEPSTVPAGMAGLPEGEQVEGLRLRPGLAMSQDGRNWARIEADHHTGALFDVGEGGEWDELFVGTPQVVNAGPGDMRMYYHSFDAAQQRYRVGLATSADGFSWAKQGPVFSGCSGEATSSAHDARGAASCHVLYDSEVGRHLMFYEAVAKDDTRSIGLAVSEDGKTGWKRLDRPVLAPSSDEGAWDGSSVGAPCVVAMAGGAYRLYYAGRPKGETGAWGGFGLALTGKPEEEMRFEGARVDFTRRKAL